MSKAIDIPLISSLSTEQSLTLIATIADQALDDNNPDLAQRVISMADELESRKLNPSEATLLDYFRANAWGACYETNRLKGDSAAQWEFEQPELGKQIFHLRRAMNSEGFNSVPEPRRCQILTNLGNQLSTIGRFIDSRAPWSESLRLEPRFWIALGNRGHGLMFYAEALYDSGHAAVFAVHAHRDLVQAIKLSESHPDMGENGARNFFIDCARQIDASFDIQMVSKELKGEDWKTPTKEMSASEPESDYRLWCLEKGLFLNPLNDLGAISIAARDVLHLPDIITPTHEPPIVIGMFNELKQGFVTARWLLWDGLHTADTHFSDRDVMLHSTPDCAIYGLGIEKVKAAYRLAYSILDKIAYFLNFYFKLEIAEHNVSFRKIWYDKSKGPVREQFAKLENWPLRGLYWLSKDFFEDEMKDSTEPAARALADLRNHLEHKYVKVLEIDIPAYAESFEDCLAHKITRRDLEARALRLIQLVRAALIYLSLAVHRNEKERKTHFHGLVAPMLLFPISDELKR